MSETQQEFEGKVALIAGGGARGDGIGNGRAAAIIMARRGALVVVLDRDLALAERTVEMIGAEGGEATALAGDVTVEADCKAIVQATLDAYGRLDVLDNNVGIGSRKSVVDEDPDFWDQIMRVNVRSMFLLGKYAIPAMASGGGGAIVNVSSISAIRPRGLTAYTTSKGAVIALTKAMAVDHAADGVRVNCVAPGPVYTPMVADADGGMPPERREQRRKASPLGIEGEGWDIGEAVAFLSSERARYITGQVLIVDGGVSLSAAAR